MSILADSLRGDHQSYFLIELDFDGFKKRISTSDQQVENSGGNPLLFEGLIANDVRVASSCDLSSFRYSASAVNIDMINTDNFETSETRHRIDNGTAKIWLWSPSMDWSDLEDYPIFQGSFRKARHGTDGIYSFDIEDFSATKGLVLSTVSISEEHPADICHRILQAGTTLSNDEMDIGSFCDLKIALPGWLFSTTVDDKVDSFDLLDRIMRQCRCFRWQKNGKVAAVVFDMAGPTVTWLRDEDFILNDCFFSMTSRDLICNRIAVDYNYSAGSFGSEKIINHSNNVLCKRSKNDYGQQAELSMSLADCATLAMATASANRHLEFFAFRHDLFEATVPHWLGFDVKEGDVGKITHASGPSVTGNGWDNERCILLDRTFTREGIKQRWWRIAT